MVVASLTRSRNYKSRIFKNEGQWYIDYNWLIKIEGPYTTWDKAYKQAFLKTSLIRSLVDD